jgi:MFS family permease
MKRSLAGSGLSETEISGAMTRWKGINSIWQNIGAFFGMILFGRCAQRFGRRPVFIAGFLLAMLSTIGFYQFFNGPRDVWMSAIMGACQLGLFAGFAIYLPELFPLRLRSTGTSFCYNVGRFIAAAGPLLTGKLQGIASAGAGTPDQKIEA